jgi:predicted  nucleic acid-binding Zn-ribbon protein
MKKILLIIGIMAVFSAVSVAQTETDTIQQLKRQIENLENRNARLSGQVNRANSNIRRLEGRVSASMDSMNILKHDLAMTNRSLQAMAENLEQQIKQLSDKTDSNLSALSIKVNHNAILNWVVALFAIVVIPLILFGWLRNRLTSLKTTLSDQIKSSSEAIMSEINKLDNQVFWSLDLLKNINKSEEDEPGTVDHSLALKVADEIVRIQKNITKMDPETKGLKKLESAIERIQDDFRDKGYEMVELLNKPYDPAMQISAKFKLDETLKNDEQVITRIIKPQVNYNRTIIQEAEVEVSTGKLPSP